MSEPVILGLLGFLGVLSTSMSGVVVAMFNTMRKDVKAVKHEVKNDHKTNFRDEQDVRHNENSDKLNYVVSAVAWLVGIAVDNRKDITNLQEHTGQPVTRRSARLARERPPIIGADQVPTTPTIGETSEVHSS